MYSSCQKKKRFPGTQDRVLLAAGEQANILGAIPVLIAKVTSPTPPSTARNPAYIVYSKFGNLQILQVFGGVVLGCIKTKICKQILVCILQHFSSHVSPVCPCVPSHEMRGHVYEL